MSAPKKLHVRTGDLVLCMSGEEQGKEGKVLRVFRGRGRAVVEGLNIVKKAVRKTQDNPQGGIVEKEAPLHISNLKVKERASATTTESKKTK